MTNLEQRIHDLPPERFARSAHAAAALAIRAAELAGKEPPASAVWLESQSSEQLSAQQQQRLQGEAKEIHDLDVLVERHLADADTGSAGEGSSIPAAMLFKSVRVSDRALGTYGIVDANGIVQADNVRPVPAVVVQYGQSRPGITPVVEVNVEATAKPQMGKPKKRPSKQPVAGTRLRRPF